MARFESDLKEQHAKEAGYSDYESEFSSLDRDIQLGKSYLTLFGRVKTGEKLLAVENYLFRMLLITPVEITI